jgi:hypothetical protein
MAQQFLIIAPFPIDASCDVIWCGVQVLDTARAIYAAAGEAYALQLADVCLRLGEHRFVTVATLLHGAKRTIRVGRFQSTFGE